MKLIKMRIEEVKESIAGYLTALAILVRQRNAMKLYDINIHCEDFYCELLNEVLRPNHRGLRLVSANTPLSPNCKGIDLVDTKHKVVVQVTSESTNAKVKETFQMIRGEKAYAGFTLYFVFIAGVSEKIDLRVNRAPRTITCRHEHLLYPERISGLLQGDAARCRNVLKILREHLGASDDKEMKLDDCFCFINLIAGLYGRVGHVRSMCDEFLEDSRGLKGFGMTLVQRINHQVNDDIPYSLPDLSLVRQRWARDIQIYGMLLRVNEYVFDIDCAGRLDAREVDVKKVRELTDALMSLIQQVIIRMSRKAGVNHEVALSELLMRVNA